MRLVKDNNRIALLFFAGLLVYASIHTYIFYSDRSTPVAGWTDAGISLTETPVPLAAANDKAAVNASNVSLGYFGVCYTGDCDTVKIIVQQGEKKNIYDLAREKYGEYVFLPFHAGNGEYEVSVWERLYGITYKPVLQKSMDVKMDDESIPFLYPSLTVDFSKDSLATCMAEDIAQTVTSDIGFVKAVYKWVAEGIEYDYELEEAVKAGKVYRSVVDDVMVSRKGICIDYATVMASMLRSRGIPAKVVVGSVMRGNKVLFPNHTWVSAYVGSWGKMRWVDIDPTYGATTDWLFGMKAPLLKYIPDYYY